MNETAMEQVVEGARVAQLLVAPKLNAVVVVGMPICSAVALVLARVIVCCADALPGTLLKVSADGLRDRPESGEPYPVRVAVAVVVPACNASVPVRVPNADGVKAISTKQEEV